MIDKNEIEMKRIAKIIKRNMKDIEINGYAKHMNEALKNIKDNTADIIIIKIDMEDDMGFSIIEELLKYDPRINIIIYSNGENTKYLRKAMELKVFDYILSPVCKKNLIPVLIKVYEKLEQDKRMEDIQKRSEIIFNEGRESLDFCFIYTILFNADTNNQRKKLQEVFNVRNWGYVIYVSFDISQQINPIPYEVYSMVIKRNAPYGYHCVIGSNVCKRIIVLVMEIKENILDEKSKKLQQIRFAESIRKYFLTVHQAKVTIGIGSEKTIDKMSISYEEALRGMRIEKESNITHVSNYKISRNKQKHFFMEMEQRMLQAVRNGDVEAFTSFSSILGTMDDIGLNEKKNKIFELLTLASYEVNKNGSISEEISYAKLMMELENIAPEELNNWACTQLCLIVQNIRDYHDEQSFGILRNVVRYIDNHFDEELSLNEMAGLTNVSPQYFSRLFKEKMGMNFVDYLTNIRINKAVEWLKFSDKNIQEICYDVGYKDPNYFSRVFKKVTGVNPKVYIEKRTYYR